MKQARQKNSAKRFMERGVRILWKTLLCMVILSCIVLIAESVLWSSQIPGNFVFKPGVEKNHAMEPTVKRGDFIILVRVNDTLLQEGAVVSYQFEQQFVLGRIVATENGAYWIKGDADAKDTAKLVQKEEIRGVWNGFRIPILGYPILWVQTVPGFVLIFVLFLMLDLLLSALIRRKVKKEGKEPDRNTGFGFCGVLLLNGCEGIHRKIRKNGGTHK